METGGEWRKPSRCEPTPATISASDAAKSLLPTSRKSAARKTYVHFLTIIVGARVHLNANCETPHRKTSLNITFVEFAKKESIRHDTAKLRHPVSGGTIAASLNYTHALEP